jgi:hypothetical protein
MAVGFPTKANWAAGDVLTASALDDLAGTVNTVQYLKPWNQVLNSNFSVWQRATTFSQAASTSTYIADRWQFFTGANEAATVARYATSDTTNLPNIQYCVRVQRNSGQTGTANMLLSQPFESVNSIPYAGKSVTLSFYARAGANYSAATSQLQATVQTGTGTDQNPLVGGYTGGAYPINSFATLTPTWQRFSFTGTIASTATEMTVYFTMTPTGTALAADYFEITGVQLEQGSVANTYQPNASTLQGELAAAQRYYYRVFPNASASILCPSLYCSSSTLAYGTLQFPTQMRIMPTALEQTGTASDYVVYASTGGTTCSAIPTFYDANYNSAVVKFTVASGLNTGYSGYARTGSTAGYLGWSAEL